MLCVHTQYFKNKIVSTHKNYIFIYHFFQISHFVNKKLCINKQEFYKKLGKTNGNLSN